MDFDRVSDMQCGARKSAPKVVAGKVQKKNNWSQSTDYYYAPQPRVVIVDRRRPDEGYKHVLRIEDIYKFLELLPEWNHLAVGLNAIVLAPGSQWADGLYHQGVVHICAWREYLWLEASESYYQDHANIFERLGVPCEELPSGEFLCKFDEGSVRAYQLLHILLHELGHHHDRMTTRSQKQSSRGEPYAEAYAIEHEALIWERYWKAFKR